MSRVFDALNRSGHERSDFREVHLEKESPIPAAGPIPVSAAAHTVQPQPTPTASSPTASALAALLNQCPQTVWKPDMSKMLFFNAEEQVESTEELRSLRSCLYQARDSQPLKKILVASSVPGEGRSFMAANLAQVMACQPGCRTLLIDADLRHPHLNLDLGTSQSPGLSEFLLGENDEFGIIRRGQMESLFFIPSGRPISAQSEVLSNGRLKVLLDRLEPLFDWVVVDSPAAMPVSDSGLIANFCDGVVMVVRSNATSFDVVRKALHRFRPEKVVGVVLNRIPPQKETLMGGRYFGSKRDSSPAEDRG